MKKSTNFLQNVKDECIKCLAEHEKTILENKVLTKREDSLFLMIVVLPVKSSNVKYLKFQ